MRCPGQDWRYWKEDAVFEVPCPECGAAVEIFKDETSGRCTGCGNRFKNPGMDFGCAEWCALAEQCLGVVPEREQLAGSGEGALAGRLIRAVKEAFETDQTRIGRSLIVYQHAKALVAAEGGDPRVVLAASLLLEIGRGKARDASAQDGPADVRKVLEDVGADEDSIAQVCRIIDGCLRADGDDTVELRIIHDADALATLAAQGAAGDRQRLEDAVGHLLKTETAKKKVQSLLGS